MMKRGFGGPFVALGGVVEVTSDVRDRRPHPEHVACVSVVDGSPPHLAVLPGITSTLRHRIERWAADRVERLRDQGPGPDSWGVWVLRDGRMAAQLWVRPVRVQVSADDYPSRPDQRTAGADPVTRQRSSRDSAT